MPVRHRRVGCSSAHAGLVAGDSTTGMGARPAAEPQQRRRGSGGGVQVPRRAFWRVLLVCSDKNVKALQISSCPSFWGFLGHFLEPHDTSAHPGEARERWRADRRRKWWAVRRRHARCVGATICISFITQRNPQLYRHAPQHVCPPRVIAAPRKWPEGRGRSGRRACQPGDWSLGMLQALIIHETVSALNQALHATQLVRLEWTQLVRCSNRP
jgi:hypothetical protein